MILKYWGYKMAKKINLTSMMFFVSKYGLKSISCLLILSILSCSTNSGLTDRDLMINPYKEGDFFVFSNYKGGVDTFFVERVQRYKAEVDPLDVIPKHYEVLEVVIRYPNSTLLNGQRSYDRDVFFDLSAAKNGNTLIGFRFKSKGVKFYSEKRYSKFILEEKRLSSLNTKNHIYTDVLKIKSLDTEYEQRSDFITAIYWSKSKGYVRYDLKNGTYSELQ